MRIMLICVLGLAGLLPVCASAQFYQEAPDLAQRVASGALPPVAERVSGNPLLLRTEQTLGRYGGVWRLSMIGRADGLLLYRTIGYEPLVRWDRTWRRVVPNLAQSVHASDDARVFTFHLRPGLRWSDGHPFTTSDIRFWFEDVFQDTRLMPEPPAGMPDDRHAVRLEVLDETTVRFRFLNPNALFLETLALGQNIAGMTEMPRHVLARYHQRYSPDAVADAMREAGLTEWNALFRLKSGYFPNHSDVTSLLRRPVDSAASIPTAAEAVPTLNAWVVDHYEPGPPPRVVAVRNPYYWKVDSVGSQLPYIDRVEFLLSDGPEEVLALLRGGEIGMQARHMGSPIISREIADLVARGYRTIALIPSESNVLPIVPNLTHPDPGRRELLSSREFRIALSLAIDRPAIIKKVFGGLGSPCQAAPRSESRFYSQTMAHQYTEYDPAAANARLDALGLGRRDADGIRRARDGRRVSFTVLARRDRPEQGDGMSMVVADWRAVGVEATVRILDRSEQRAAVRDNNFDVVVGQADGGIDPILEPALYVMLHHESDSGPAWLRWLRNPGDPGAEEPSPTILHQRHLYDRIMATLDRDQQDRLIREILDIAASEFFTMGVASRSQRHGVIRADFHNVPPTMPESWAYPTPAPTNPSQYFIAAPG